MLFPTSFEVFLFIVHANLCVLSSHRDIEIF